MRCGAVAGYCKNRRLENRCRGVCPTGSRGPIRRLAMGRHPHPQRGMGEIWPDGEMNPRPTRWTVDERIWDYSCEATCGHDGNTPHANRDVKVEETTQGYEDTMVMLNRGTTGDKWNGDNDCWVGMQLSQRSGQSIDNNGLGCMEDDLGLERPPKRSRF